MNNVVKPARISIKNWLLLFLLFYAVSEQLAAKNIAFDKEKVSLKYFHDKESLFSYEEIRSRSKNFSTLNEAINDGFNNGKYWISLRVLNESSQSYSLEIPFSHTNKVLCYRNGKLVDPQPNSRFKLFHFDNLSNQDDLTLEVNCTKEAFIPIGFCARHDFYKTEYSNYLIIGLYYGIALSILTLHLFYFSLFGESTYGYYALMLVSLTFTLSYRDGIWYMFLGDGWFHDHIEPFFNLMVAVSLAFFSSTYLQHKRYLPRFKYIGGAALATAIIALTTYLIKDTYEWFVITELSIISCLTVYFITGLILWNKNIYSKFFVIAYFPILISSYEHYNSAFFGFTFIGIDIEIFRIGGVFEMAVFTFAITYQARKWMQEKQGLEIDVETRNKELTTFTLQMAEKNTFIRSIQEQMQLSKVPDGIKEREWIRKTNKLISQSLSAENSWEEFKIRFERVNSGFYQKLKSNYPDLTAAEVRLAALAMLNLSVKETASLLNLGERSVISARSRLRKKMALSKDDNLSEALKNM